MIDLSRQFLIINDISNYSFVLIGAGGLGSNAAYTLACLGGRYMVVFDDDDVEEPNIAPAFYGNNDVGKKKVEALAERIEEMVGTKIQTISKKYTDEKIEQADFVVVTTDGLSKRREVWQAGSSNIQGWQYWLDLRMGGAVCSCICIPNYKNILFFQYQMGDVSEDEYNQYHQEAVDKTEELMSWYETTYLTGEDAEVPCGEKATAFITKGTAMGLLGDVIYYLQNNMKLPLVQIKDTEMGNTHVKWIEGNLWTTNETEE